jgi:Flp pilus assembly pilin Flp
MLGLLVKAQARLVADEGVTAVEYGILVAAFAVITLVAWALRGTLSALFGAVAGRLSVVT